MVPDDVDLDRVWLGITTQVWRREPSRLERAATRLLRSPGLGRSLVTTPSLLVPWIVASVLVFGVGVLATVGTDQPLVSLIAPGMAAAAVAYAYGPGIDPAWELSQSMAVGERMVLLVRVLAVFAVNSVLGLAASLASSVAASLVFGWLVPMTAISALALATATVSRSANAGVAAGVSAWVMTVLLAQSVTGHLTAAVVAPALILPYLLCAVGCVGVVLYATRSTRG